MYYHFSIPTVATDHGEIIAIRVKHLEKISKAIALLTKESSHLKTSLGYTPINTNNDVPANTKLVRTSDGQAWTFGDGTRALSCLQYRNTTYPYQYENQGSGLYVIEPSIGLIMTVYCDMTTDGGGWTLISGIRNNYGGVHFHTFEDSTAVSSSDVTSFHIKTSALLTHSTQVRAASDTASQTFSTFYLSSWSYSASCVLTTALRNAIQNTPTVSNGDLAASCKIISGLSQVPTSFTYGRSSNGHSTGFRMGFPDSGYPGHLNAQSYATYSYTGAPEGTKGAYNGVYHSFSGEIGRNGAVFLR